jgi:hypothetical protein
MACVHTTSVSSQISKCHAQDSGRTGKSRSETEVIMCYRVHELQ